MTGAGASSVSSEAPSALDQVRAWMESRAVSAVFISNPVSVAYLTGFSTEPHERLLALLLSRSRSVLVVPGLEEESASAAARGVTVRAWRDGTDPWAEVAAVLGASGSGGLAVEKGDLRLEAWERLQAISGAGAPVDVGRQIRAMRARKRPDELARLKEAGRITDAMAERAIGAVRPGLRELELATEIALAVAEAGAQLSFETLVQSGPNSALPHLRPSVREFQPGELLLIDCGGAWEGYKADITRTIAVGGADRRQREVHDTVLHAHDAAVAAVRAGVRAGDVDRAAREVIEAAGYGEHFIHRTGHGLGLEAHEDPSLDPGSEVVLESGMVVTIEPGVYLPGWGGVRIEDDVVVEERGCRLLTNSWRGLEPPGAA
ncbi:MAG: Xaa-Pro peptidase family protein [Candidatus Dormibacteraeota bacterium]|nr:Xaa-Pro peptidase family protein [Candidatus Dormibacteraeota bacterium]